MVIFNNDSYCSMNNYRAQCKPSTVSMPYAVCIRSKEHRLGAEKQLVNKRLDRDGVTMMGHFGTTKDDRLLNLSQFFNVLDLHILGQAVIILQVFLLFLQVI